MVVTIDTKRRLIAVPEDNYIYIYIEYKGWLWGWHRGHAMLVLEIDGTLKEDPRLFPRLMVIERNYRRVPLEIYDAGALDLRERMEQLADTIIKNELAKWNGELEVKRLVGK